LISYSWGVCLIDVCYQKRDGAWFGVAMQNDSVVATCFSLGEPDLGRLLERLPKDAEYRVVDELGQKLSFVLDVLEKIFSGELDEFSKVNVDSSRRSEYEDGVLWCTGLVPVGYVTAYGSISKVVGGSARAVGRVEASNVVPLLVPCHRVVKSDLSIGGYSFGKKLKVTILEREKKGYKEPKVLEVNGRELVLFPVEWVKQHGEL
jgi:O-6-methylguanine DNA methyltransferase